MAAPQIRCPQLLDCAHLSIYRENPFRITGLPITASSKEINRQADKLKVYQEIGHGAAANNAAFALQPAPSLEVVREAIQRLKEPEKRLVDEFFWFWPIDDAKSDPALEAIQQGDGITAERLWVQGETDQPAGVIATHNVVVCQFLKALDRTLDHINSGSPVEDTAMIPFWNDVHRRWNSVIKSEVIWSFMKNRVTVLNDPRLTVGLVRRMEETLPAALMKIHAEAALKFAETSRMGSARTHVEFMREIESDDATARASIIEEVLEPTLNRNKRLLVECREMTDKEGLQGKEQGRLLAQQSQASLAVMEVFLGAESPDLQSRKEMIAEAIHFCAVRHRLAKGPTDVTVELLRSALSFAPTAEMREDYRRQLAIVEEESKLDLAERFLTEITQTMESKAPAKEKGYRLTRLFQDFKKFLQAERREPALINFVSQRFAWTLRSVGIEAVNQEKDVLLGLELVKVAMLAFKLCMETNEELRTALEKDLKTLTEMERQARCHFCAKPSRENFFVPNPMCGEVVYESHRMAYRKREVQIPACEQCGKMGRAQNSVRSWLVYIALCLCFLPRVLAARLGWVLVIVYGFALFNNWHIIYKIHDEVISPMLFVLTICFFPAALSACLDSLFALQMRDRNEFIPIKELLAQGWRHGEEPATFWATFLKYLYNYK